MVNKVHDMFFFEFFNIDSIVVSYLDYNGLTYSEKGTYYFYLYIGYFGKYLFFIH